MHSNDENPAGFVPLDAYPGAPPCACPLFRTPNNLPASPSPDPSIHSPPVRSPPPTHCIRSPWHSLSYPPSSLTISASSLLPVRVHLAQCPTLSLTPSTHIVRGRGQRQTKGTIRAAARSRGQRRVATDVVPGDHPQRTEAAADLPEVWRHLTGGRQPPTGVGRLRRP